MTTTPPPIENELQPRDWTEIYCALESKAHAIQCGDLGPEEPGASDAEWIGHLTYIMGKIEHLIE